MNKENENKYSSKKYIVSIGVIAAVIIAIVAFILIRPNNNKQISELAKTYYEENLYDTLKFASTDNEVFDKYKEEGLTITLEELMKVETIANSKVGQKVQSSNCELTESKVKIYPEAPYEKSNYRIEVESICK